MAGRGSGNYKRKHHEIERPASLGRFRARCMFIYALLDPRDKSIRYVGKTRDPECRLSNHYCDRTASAARVAWMDDLKAAGELPYMVILATASKYEASAVEAAWIEFLALRGEPLCNVHGNPAHSFERVEFIGPRRPVGRPRKEAA